MLPKKILDTEYFVWGDQPQLLLTSGMHGDEIQVTRVLKKYIEPNYQKLPSFVYIPMISRTACAIGSRRNENRKDLNRSFISGTSEREVQAVMQIVSSYKFNLAIDFHEDRDRTTSFYLYDNCGRIETPAWKRITQKMAKIGVSMYEGWDDPEDPDLGHKVKQGYLPITIDQLKTDMGFMSGWLIRNGISPRVIDPEILGKASLETKKKIVEVLIEEFALLKYKRHDKQISQEDHSPDHLVVRRNQSP